MFVVGIFLVFDRLTRETRLKTCLRIFLPWDLIRRSIILRSDAFRYQFSMQRHLCTDVLAYWRVVKIRCISINIYFNVLGYAKHIYWFIPVSILRFPIKEQANLIQGSWTYGRLAPQWVYSSFVRYSVTDQTPKVTVTFLQSLNKGASTSQSNSRRHRR